MIEHRVARPSVARAVLLTLCACAALAAVWSQRGRFVDAAWGAARDELAKSAQPDTPHEYLRNTDTILVAVRNLRRLETVSFHMERVIDLKEEHQRAFGMLHAQDAILLVAAGDVVAGLDLSKLARDDVQVKPAEHRVLVRLPPPEILSVTLDDERTYVHSRHTTLLTTPVADLETRARKLAVSAIRDAALAAGVLERARATATQTLRALLGSLDYEVQFVQHE